MTSSARILLLAARDIDARHLQARLVACGVDAFVTAAPTAPAIDALRGTAFDVLLAPDHAAARDLLSVAQQACPEASAIVYRVGPGRSTPVDGDTAVVRVDALDDVAGALARTIPRVVARSRALREATLRVRTYQRLFDNACDAILVIDLATGRLVDANPMAVELLGYPRERLIDHPAAELGDAAWAECVTAAPAQGDRWRGDVVLATAAGEPLTLDASMRVYEAAGLRVAQWHLRDVSALRRMERQVRTQERLLQRIVDCSPDRIALLDHAGGVEWISPGEGHGDPVAAATDWVTCWSDDAHPSVRHALDAARRGEVGHFTAQDRERSHCYDVRIAGVPGESGGIVHILAIARDISLLRDTQERLMRREAHLRSILHSSPDAIVTTDTEGRVTEFNPAAERLLGRDRDDVVGAPFGMLVPPATAVTLERRRARFVDGERPRLLGRVVRLTAIASDGTRIPVDAVFERLGLDEPPTFAAFLRDRRAQVEVARLAARHTRRLVRLAEFGREALLERNPDRLVEAAIHAAMEGTGASRACLLQPASDGRGLHVRARIGWPAQATDGKAAAAAGAADDHAIDVPFVAHGAEQVAHACGARLLGGDGLESALEIPIAGSRRFFGLLGVYDAAPFAFDEDAAEFLASLANLVESAVERLDAEALAARLEEFDALTGLVHGRLARDRIAQALLQASRHGRMLGVMVLGIDRLRQVNDLLGMPAGDALLKEVAARLKSVAGAIEVLGRLGGDEFVLAWNDFDRAEAAAEVAQRIVAAFAAPIPVAGTSVHATVSAGVTVGPVDGSDVDILLANADAALHRAKQDGGNACVFFGQQCHLRVRERLELERELRDALAHGGFELVYQPQRCTTRGRTVGAEALLRWRHPRRGLLAPDQFLDVAEESGLIVDIGAWVLRTASDMAVRLQRFGYGRLSIAVNVSPVQMRKGDLVQHVQRVLATTGLDPALLELEITENLAMDGSQPFIDALARLRDEGVRIAIDDFGTGYSSLSYLKRFPIHRLKIDRSFIADICDDTDEPVSRAIIALSHELGFEVVAEGVENAGQEAFLRRHGCDVLQGYRIARPMSARAFVQWLKTRDRPAAEVDA